MEQQNDYSNNAAVRYTYVRHPMQPDWCITIARAWANEERTALKVTWCANKSVGESPYWLRVMEKFDRRRSHRICRGRLLSEKHYVIMQLPKPYVRGDGPELVPQILEFVVNHPNLPVSLRKLLQAAAAAEYTLLPRNCQLSDLETIRALYALNKRRSNGYAEMPPNCS